MSIEYDSNDELIEVDMSVLIEFEREVCVVDVKKLIEYYEEVMSDERVLELLRSDKVVCVLNCDSERDVIVLMS